MSFQPVTLDPTLPLDRRLLDELHEAFVSLNSDDPTASSEESRARWAAICDRLGHLIVRASSATSTS